jgi:hypothetical protein
MSLIPLPDDMPKKKSLVEEITPMSFQHDILQYRIQQLQSVSEQCPYDMEVNDYLQRVAPAQYSDLKQFNDLMRKEHERQVKMDKLFQQKMTMFLDNLPDEFKI